MELSPAVILFAALGLAAVGYAFFRSLQDVRNIWMILAGMIFASGLAVQIDRNLSVVNQTYLTPIQHQRAPIYLALGCVLFIIMLVNSSRVRISSIPVQGAMILAIQFYTALIRIFHEGAPAGLSSMVFAFVTMLPVMMLVHLAIREWDDFNVMLRLFGFAGFVWASATAVQVVIDHRQLVMGWQNRFSGLLGNPQGCGLFMAPLTVTTLWLLLNDHVRKLRPIWYATLGMLVVYTLWTGSRTGFGELVLGSLFVLYSRLGKTVLLAPLLAIPLLIAYQIFLSLGLSVDAVERLASTQNTRESSWRILLEDAFANPVLGTGMAGTRANENSYLIAFGAYGFLCGVLVFALVGVSVAYLLKFVRYRSSVPRERRPLVDLILGFNAMFFAGAMFEWFIISRLESMLIYMLIFATMSKRVIEMVDQERAALAEHHGDDAYADYAETYADAEPTGDAGPHGGGHPTHA
ncbi:MAG: hypothetical protein HRU70_06445 [Phycisphaeraceae bacterium]|nr:MAG: hypothetical protein HRU70_06445 [Phycisphaeraceae bacterium]